MAQPVYNSQLDAFTLYHLIHETSSPSPSPTGPILPALGHALAGSLATATAKALLYPLELVITRLQVQRQLRHPGEATHAAKDADAEYDGLLDAARKIYASEGGLRAFYTGCAPDVGKGIADSFVFFLGYTFLRQWELRKGGGGGKGKGLSVGKELGVGVAAGALAKAFTTPVQNIVTRQQTAALVAARDPASSAREGDALSVKDIALQIRNEQGLRGFWNGYSASVVLTLNPALTFAVDNALKRLLLPKGKRENPSPQVIFLIAAMSKAVATAVTYPAMLAKSRAQTAGKQTPDEEEEKEAGEKIGSSGRSKASNRRRALQRLLRLFQPQYALLLSLRRIYAAEGLNGLYSGLEAEVLKGFLQHGLTMTFKDRVFAGVVQTYYLLLKLTRRWEDEVKKAQAMAKGKAEEVGEAVKEGGDRVWEGVRGS